MAYHPLIEQFLQQRLGGDPQMQTLLAMMQSQQITEAEIVEGPPAPYVSGTSVSEEKLEKAHQHIHRLKKRLLELETYLSELEAADEELAHALGACIYCWGEDTQCRSCRGRGVPGSQEPDPILFKQLILPAVRRMKTAELQQKNRAS